MVSAALDHKHHKHGVCTLPIGNIAALAAVSETTVRNAVRAARALALVPVEERRLSAWRKAPNVVTITSCEWNTWLHMRRRGWGQALVRTCPAYVIAWSLWRHARQAAAQAAHIKRRPQP
jgi:hypothetical protein